MARDQHMTVGHLRESMSQNEFMHWQIWYERQRQTAALEARKANRGGR